MEACMVDLDVSLPQDGIIELLLVQWHTSVPIRANAYKIPQVELSEKKTVIANISRWLTSDQRTDIKNRPLFVLMPEVSLPVELAPEVRKMVSLSPRPIVVVAGLEYIEWKEYVRWQKETQNPVEEVWVQGGEMNPLVNAAIVIVRDAKGSVREYIQPKTYPNDEEQAVPIYCGKGLFVFRSVSQEPGARLNFSVRICSDFTSTESVIAFRDAVCKASAGLPLDMTFVIQCNRDQEAEHFKQGIQAYFAARAGACVTTEGALVFINNANPSIGKSNVWGNSALFFPYGRWRLLGGSPTYWTRKDGPHNHEAVKLRQSGPGLYLLAYRPHYLASSIPGSGQPLPFPEAYALFSSIDRWTGDAPGSFQPIPALLHWLAGEWGEGAKELENDLHANDVDPRLATAYRSLYEQSTVEWTDLCSTSESETARSVASYFRHCPNCGSHGGCFPGGGNEPMLNCGSAGLAVKRFMGSYSLIQMSLDDPQSIRPILGTNVHCRMDTLGEVAFVWGCDRISPQKAVIEFRNHFFPLGPKSCLLVVVNPYGEPSPESITGFIERSSKNVADAQDWSSLPEPLKVGSVVRPSTSSLRYLSSRKLEGLLVVKSLDEYREKARTLLGGDGHE